MVAGGEGMSDAVWEMWDEEPDEEMWDEEMWDDFDPDACPECERPATWDGDICVCEHCGYIGTGEEVTA